MTWTSRSLLHLAAALAIGVVMPGVLSAQEKTSRKTAAHYLVIEAAEVSKMEVVHYQRVMLAGPLVSLDDKTLAAHAAQAISAQSSSALVRLRNKAGRIVYQGLVSVPRVMLAEARRFPSADKPRAADKPMDASKETHVVPLTRSSFVVRVPAVPDANDLDVEWLPSPGDSGWVPDWARRARINLSDLADRWVVIGPVRPTTTIEAVPGRAQGSPENRLDILFVAEGYRSMDLPAFRGHTDALATGFLSQTPFLEYSGHVNMWRMHVPSWQRGADRPPCPMDAEANGWDDGTTVSTAFDATYCADGVIWRLLSVNASKVFAAAAAAPDWDDIVVIVQSPLYGGAGGGGTGIAVISLSPINTIEPEQVSVMLHEFGHGFGALVDEYVSAALAARPDSQCSDRNTPGLPVCPANVTDETDPLLIKWRRWIAPTTPIPTIAALARDREAGLWEGARGFEFGMYRQCFDGRMQHNFRPFCDVDTEALLTRLYNGGWGSPAAGIEMIEPGTRAPVDSARDVRHLDTIRLQAQVLGPAGGLSVRVQWYVDNQLQVDTTAASGATVFFDYFAEDFGATDTIKLRVTDQSPLIHNTIRAMSVDEESWTITVIGPCRLDCPTSLPYIP